jgi:hypothetical protein
MCIIKQYFIQIVHSLALILITQTVFDIIGYNWTFIICGFCGTLGNLSKFLNLLKKLL